MCCLPGDPRGQWPRRRRSRRSKTLAVQQSAGSKSDTAVGAAASSPTTAKAANMPFLQMKMNFDMFFNRTKFEFLNGIKNAT